MHDSLLRHKSDHIICLVLPVQKKITQKSLHDILHHVTRRHPLYSINVSTVSQEIMLAYRKQQTIKAKRRTQMLFKHNSLFRRKTIHS